MDNIITNPSKKTKTGMRLGLCGVLAFLLISTQPAIAQTYADTSISAQSYDTDLNPKARYKETIAESNPLKRKIMERRNEMLRKRQSAETSNNSPLYRASATAHKSEQRNRNLTVSYSAPSKSSMAYSNQRRGFRPSGFAPQANFAALSGQNNGASSGGSVHNSGYNSGSNSGDSGQSSESSASSSGAAVIPPQPEQVAFNPPPSNPVLGNSVLVPAVTASAPLPPPPEPVRAVASGSPSAGSTNFGSSAGHDSGSTLGE